jgi:hypothetical protein
VDLSGDGRGGERERERYPWRSCKKVCYFRGSIKLNLRFAAKRNVRGERGKGQTGSGKVITGTRGDEQKGVVSS